MPTPTHNFGWLKPDVGGSTGAWGTLWNTDLDGIDTIVGDIGSVVGGIAGVVSNASNLTLTAGATPATNNVFGKRGATVRWAIVMPDGESETGSNAGSNFLIQAYSDAGAYLFSPIEIIRATGQAVFSSNVYINGTQTVVGATQTNGVAAFESGIVFPNYYGHTFQFGWDGTHARISVDGTDIGAITIGGGGGGGAFLPLTGGTITGNLAVTGSVSSSALNSSLDASIGRNLGVTGNMSAGGNISCNGNMGASGFISANGNIVSNGNTIQGGFVNSTGTVQGTVLQAVGGSTYISNGVVQVNTNNYLEADSSGTVIFAGNTESMDILNGGAIRIYNSSAVKPSGTAWSNPSDIRIKTVERKYELGLGEVLQLDPIVYRLKDNDVPPGKTRAPLKDQLNVGLVAQEVEKIFPGMVTKQKGWIDGVEVDDFRQIDTSELIFALVNSVKTLTARLEALEAKAA